MNTPELDLEVEVNGMNWTDETRMIAALVKRLGGDVTLSEDEIEDVRGLILYGGYTGGRVTAA